MNQDTPLMIPTGSETRFSEFTGPATKPHSTRILSISPAQEDHEELRKILSGVNIAAVGTRREAATFLCLERVSVVLCESKLPDGTWKDILSHVAGFTEMPAIVVTSRLADDYLWAEVLNLGGYDVLAKPFNRVEVKRVLAAALRQKANESNGVLVAHAAGSAYE